MRTFAMVAFFCALLISCGGSNPSNGNSNDVNPSNLTGNWEGQLTSSTPGHSRGVALFMTQSGASLVGPRVLFGLTQSYVLCDFGGTMRGTSTNGQIDMTLVVPPNPTRANLNETVVLSGTVHGGAIAGTYRDTDGCLKGDSGTFQISPAPSVTSSQWSGTWTGPFGGSGSAAADLQEDALARITGTVTLGGGVCDNLPNTPQNVTGTMTGTVLDMDANIAGTSYAIGGSVSSDGKTLDLVHMCQDLLEETMNITLTRP